MVVVGTVWWHSMLRSSVDNSFSAFTEHVGLRIDTIMRTQQETAHQLAVLSKHIADAKYQQHPAPTPAPALMTSPKFQTLKRQIVNTPDGVNFVVYERPHGGWWTSLNRGKWEANTFRVIKSHVAPGKVYIDFGAWIGPTVLYAAAFTDRVYALEPDRTALEALNANIETNPFLKKNIVSVSNRCIAQKRSKLKLTFQTGPADSNGQVIPDDDKVQNEKKLFPYEVDCLPLREYCDEMGIEAREISLIKIDTEGGERFIMPNIAKWFRNLPAPKPSIWLSVHEMFFPNKTQSLRDVTAAVKECGYKYVLNYELQELRLTSDILPSSTGGMYLLTDLEQWRGL